MVGPHKGGSVEGIDHDGRVEFQIVYVDAQGLLDSLGRFGADDGDHRGVIGDVVGCDILHKCVELNPIGDLLLAPRACEDQ